ncbi:diguanylate cyclase [Paenibacillus sp. sgz302251]|uniref:GGDEF domain-containing protein n=1 Tax=Paenibacillus sp. sgz302251 TaxID=3414493 RepID=UPI003C7E1870
MDDQLNYAPCGFLTLSNAGIITEVNQTLRNMLHYERNELLECHIESLMSVANKMFFHTYFYPFIQLYGHVNEMIISLKTRRGEDLPVLLNGIRKERNGETFIDCVIVEMRKRIKYEKEIIQMKRNLEELYKEKHAANEQLKALHQQYEMKQAELIKLNGQLETLALTDELTGLNNRRYFQESLVANIALYNRVQLPFSILLLDIDHFKRINDTYGHPVGDKILQKLAKLIKFESREVDIVARYGGEEFVIILPNTNQSGAVQAAERCRKTIEKASWDDEYFITVSIGVATISHGDNDHTLLVKADRALYASKSSGRNCVTHSSDLNQFKHKA